MLNLLMIQNIGGRLNNLEPLLNSIVNQGLGKKDGLMYIVNCSITMTGNNSKEVMTISLIHREATIKGFNNVIYDLSKV